MKNQIPSINLFSNRIFNTRVLRVLFVFMLLLVGGSTFSQTWTGAVSTAWEDPANWSTGILPTTGNDATIPTSPTGGRFPVISSGTYGVKKLKMQTNATVTQTGGVLQVAADWENKGGTYNGTGGTVEMVGNGGGGTTFTAGYNFIHNLVINNGVDPNFDNNIGYAINISGNLTNHHTGLDIELCSFIFNGTADQQIFCAAGTSRKSFGELTVNKPSGTVTLNSNIKTNSHFTLTAGTFNTGTNNTLEVGGNGNFDGGTFNKNNSPVTITGIWYQSGSVLTGGSGLIITGGVVRTAGDMNFPGGTLAIGGNYVNNSASNTLGTTVYFTGTGRTISGTTPTSFSSLYIYDGAAVTMNNSNSADLLTLAQSANDASLTLATGITFTVNGNATITQPSASKIVALNVNAGNLVVNGNLNIGGSNTSTGRVARMVITTGTAQINGNIVYNSSGTSPVTAAINVTAAGTIRLKGNLLLTNGSGTLSSHASSLFIFEGPDAQTVYSSANVNFANVTVDKTAGVLTLANNVTASGAFILQQGTFNTGVANNSFQAASITLNGGNLQVNNSAITSTGFFTNNNTIVTGGTPTIIVGGDFTRNGGSVSCTSYSISLGGNWTNNVLGSFTPCSATFSGLNKTIGGSQNTTFASLTVSTGTITATRDFTASSIILANNPLANSLTLAAGSTVNVSGDVVINQATATVLHTFFVNAATLTVNGNVIFNVTANNSGREARLTITTGTVNILGNLVMNNTKKDANSKIDMTGGAGNINLHGSVQVNSLGTLLPGTTSTFTFTGSANQTFRNVSLIQFYNVVVNKTGGTVSPLANFTTNGTLKIDNGTFSAGGFAITAQNFILNGGLFAAGSNLITVNSSWTNHGGSFTSTGTTVLNGTSNIGGTHPTTFGRLYVPLLSAITMSNNNSATELTFQPGDKNTSFTHTGSAALTVNGPVIFPQITSGATFAWNIDAGSATVNGLVHFTSTATNTNRIARIRITSGTLNAFGGITMVASANVTKVIDMSGGAGVLNLKGALTAPANSGTLTSGTAGSIFNYADDHDPQTINFFPAGNYHNLHINNTGGGATLSAAITSSNVTGNVRVQSGILNNNGVAIALANNRTFEVANDATFILGGTSAMATGTSLTKTFGVTSLVDYAGTTQNVSGETYGHLTISGSGTKTLAGSSTTQGTLTLAAGNFTLGANTLTINGEVDNEGGSWTGGASCPATTAIVVGGTGVSTTLQGIVVNSLTLNRAAGVTISGNLTICSSLALTNGILTTGSNVVIMNTDAATVSRTSGYINGNLRKTFHNTNYKTRSFEIGTASAYSPVSITFGNITTVGSLTVGSTQGDHPNITSSTVNARRSANRYWTIDNNGLAFNNYSATFTFVAAEVDQGATATSFKVGRFASGWTYPTLGTRTATTTQASGLTAFGDFAVGDDGSNSVKTWSGLAGTSNWGDANNWNPVGVPGVNDIIDLLGANTININVNASSSDLRIDNSGLTLTLNSGTTYSISGNLSLANGTLNTNAAFPTVSGQSYISGGTVGYTAASGSQSVIPLSYNNLMINGGGTKTLTANITPTGNLTVSGGILDMSTFTCNRSSAGGTLTVGSGATLLIGGTNPLPVNYSTHSLAANSTIEYAGANQVIRSPNSSQTYKNLLISGTGTKTLSANISATNVTISSSTLSAVTYQVNLSGNWVNNATFSAGTGTVLFSGTSTISGSATTNFRNINITGSLTAHAGTMNVSGNFINSNTFNHNNGTIVFNGTSTVSGSAVSNFNNISVTGTLTAHATAMNVAGSFTSTGTFNHNNGTINFNGGNEQTIPALLFHHLTSSSTGARTLPASSSVRINGNFTPGTNSYNIDNSTIEFVNAGAQNIPAFTYFNLALSGYQSVKSVTGNIAINNALELEDSSVLNMQSHLMTGNITEASGNGFVRTLNTSASPLPSGVHWDVEVDYYSASPQTIVTGNYMVLQAAGGNRTLAPGVVGIESLFTPGAGTYTTVGNTVEFNSETDQVVNAFVYNNLAIAGGGTIKTAAGATTVNGLLILNDGVVLEMGTNTLQGSMTASTGTGTLRTANTTATAIPAATYAGTVEYYSALAQTIRAANYMQLDATGGNRTLASAGTIGIAGSFTPGAGVYTITGSTIAWNGSEIQNIPVFTFNNLTLHKSSQHALLEGNITVNGILNFIKGSIRAGNNKVIISAGGSVTGAAQATGWVVPSIQKYIATGSNINTTFEVGDTSFYSPVTTAMASVSAAGNVTATNVTDLHPSLAGSALPQDKTLNRYWSFTNSSVAFTTASFTMSWIGNDLADHIHSGLLGVGLYNSSWTYPAVTVPATNTISANNVTSFGDVVLGELLEGGTWTGTVNNDWHNPENWQYSQLPDSCMHVIIPTGAPVFPVITTGVAAMKDLVVQSGTTLTATDACLKVAGNIVKNGTIITSGVSLEMNGDNPQSLPANIFTGNQVKDLAVANVAGVTLEGPLSVSQYLYIKDGSLQTNGHLILKSSENLTAQVAEITSSAQNPIVGDVTVERYIAGRRKYRLITSSVTTSDAGTLQAGEESRSIWGNWQVMGSTAQQNKGTSITGGTATAGYDQITTSPSLFTYNSSNRNFVAHSSANGKNTKYIPLTAGRAYYMFVYGDRQNTATTSSPRPTVLEAKGKLLTGDQVFNTSSTIPLSGTANTYSLIGNPYAAVVDWRWVQKSSVSNTIYGWDANLASTGGYVSILASGSTSIISPNSNQVKVSRYIQPGQGFFVQTTAANPTIVFTESCKATSTANMQNLVFRTSGNTPLLSVNLMYQVGTNRILVDGIVAAFDKSYSNNVDDEDSKKVDISTSSEAISISRGTTVLAIETRQLPKNTDTIFLKTERLARPQYILQVFADDMAMMEAKPVLYDNYLKTKTTLLISDTNYISFAVNSDPASKASDRFRIEFVQSVVLPVTYTSVSAEAKGNKALVKWQVAGEANIVKYQLMRSAEGINYATAGQVNATSGSATHKKYEWLDVQPINGTNYYQVRAIQADGSYLVSKVVTVQLASEQGITIMKNPVTSKSLVLLMNDMPKNKYKVAIFNMQGQLVYSQIFNHSGGTGSFTLPLGNQFLAGFYQLSINEETFKFNKTIMVE